MAERGGVYEWVERKRVLECVGRYNDGLGECKSSLETLKGSPDYSTKSFQILHDILFGPLVIVCHA